MMRIESSATKGSFLYIQIPDKVYRKLFKKNALNPLDDKYGLIPEEDRKNAADTIAGMSGEPISGLARIEWLLKSKGRFGKIYIEKRRSATKRTDSYIVLTDGGMYKVTSFANSAKSSKVSSIPKGIIKAHAFDRSNAYGIQSERKISLALAKTENENEITKRRINSEKRKFLDSMARTYAAVVKKSPIVKAELDRAFLPFDREIKDAFKHSEKMKDPTVLRGFFTHRLEQMDRRTLIRH